MAATYRGSCSKHESMPVYEKGKQESSVDGFPKVLENYVVDKYSSLKSYRLKNVVFSVHKKRAGHRHRPTITLKTQCNQTSTPSQPFKFALEHKKSGVEMIFHSLLSSPPSDT
ncbi:hypothetical protein GQX74_001732 [Glossina fuscipes]|nr:hypothetical protein GQX74_001732 [Glossina fuscipes]